MCSSHNNQMIIIISLVLFLFSGCNLITPLEETTDNFESIYIENVTVPDSVFLDQPFDITVTGYLPDPSWVFDHFELLDLQNNLTIKPIGKQDLTNEVFLQMLVSFEENAVFTPIRKGLLSIKVIGKNKTIRKTVIILE